MRMLEVVVSGPRYAKITKGFIAELDLLPTVMIHPLTSDSASHSYSQSEPHIFLCV